MNATPTREPHDPDAHDAVCLGETMVAFVETSDPATYVATTAGAASNVAIGMARLGLRSRWVSRLGDDPLGRFIEDTVAAAGVDVAVVRDPSAPTGVMVKHPAGSEKVSQYYRSESAARHLSPDDLARVGSTQWIHITGITPALSGSASELARAVSGIASRHGAKMSFDVNYRDRLWPSAAAAAEVLAPIARAADVLFIGNDEAEILLGTESPTALSELLCPSEDHELVLKRGSHDAIVVTNDSTTSMSALPTEVIDVTGAGDAFAAGYLSAHVWGWAADARLRLGHFMASRVVTSIHDVPDAFDDAELAQISQSGLAALWETSDHVAEVGTEMARTSFGTRGSGS